MRKPSSSFSLVCFNYFSWLIPGSLLYYSILKKLGKIFLIIFLRELTELNQRSGDLKKEEKKKRKRWRKKTEYFLKFWKSLLFIYFFLFFKFAFHSFSCYP